MISFISSQQHSIASHLTIFRLNKFSFIVISLTSTLILTKIPHLSCLCSDFDFFDTPVLAVDPSIADRHKTPISFPHWTIRFEALDFLSTRRMWNSVPFTERGMLVQFATIIWSSWITFHHKRLNISWCFVSSDNCFRLLSSLFWKLFQVEASWKSLVVEKFERKWSLCRTNCPMARPIPEYDNEILLDAQSRSRILRHSSYVKSH
jgi:hypothetical protein